MVEFEFSDYFFPQDLIRTYILLRRSEHWTRDKFEVYQGTNLARLLRFCAGEVPYYGPLFEEAGLDARIISPDNALQCLLKLPLLEKELLRTNLKAFSPRHVERFHAKRVMTSGTTGTPLTLYWDRGSNVFEFCCIQRLWRWAGIRVGDPFLDLRSRPFTGDERHLIRNGGTIYTRNWKVNGIEFSSDYIEEDNTSKYHELLLRYQPRLVRGHPQSIQHLASLLRDKSLDGWRPLAVTTASETLYEFQRREIEDAWQVPILDSYGLKEHNVFIAQCREGRYHIFPEYGICEILDDYGNPVQPGQEGWIIATGLHNYAQVLLRYNTRDRAVASDGSPCPCGRALPIIDRIIGRIDDCIFAPGGKRYSGMHFAFFGRHGIKKARLIQNDLTKVNVELVVTEQFNATERAKLMNALRQKVSDNLAFEFLIVDDIIQQTPGKFKFVICNLTPPYGQIPPRT